MKRCACGGLMEVHKRKKMEHCDECGIDVVTGKRVRIKS